MNAAQQRILKYVTKNQPVTVAMIAQHAGVSRSHYYAESLQLRMKGILKSVTGIGVFAGEEAYKDGWKTADATRLARTLGMPTLSAPTWQKAVTTTGVRRASHTTATKTAWSTSTCAAHSESE